MNFLRKQMKWVMAIIVVAFLLSTFLMYEGRSTRRTPSRNADGTMNDYEVAQINGRSLMRSELDQRLRNYLSTLSSRNTASLDMAAAYKSVLEQAVLESQLIKEIDEQGIKVSDAEAEQVMKNYADTYYPTRETFYQALAQAGVKVEDYKRNLARQIAVDQLMTRAIGDINISEDKAVEFYDSMKNLFYTQPEGFMVHMADFKTSEDAEAFRAKLAGGASWDVIASEDRAESSDIVNITKEPVFLPSSAFRVGTLSALASLDIAELSPVFSVSSSDFAVGMKASHVDETTKSYDEVSGDIKSLLTQEEQRKRLAEYEETLRTKANLVINDAELFASKEVSPDEEPAPEIIIEEVSEDATPEAVTKEAPKTEEPEVKTDEVKSEDLPVAEVAPVEEVKEVKTEEDEIKSEDVTTTEAVKEAVEETKPEETEAEIKVEEVKSDDVKEEIKEETTTTGATPAVEAETKSEDVPAVETVEEVKAEETKSEEAPAAETTKEESESKAEEAQEEVKTEETPAVETTATEEIKEEIKSEDAEVKAEIETETEAITEEIIEAVQEIAESLDIPIQIQEEVKEN